MPAPALRPLAVGASAALAGSLSLYLAGPPRAEACGCFTPPDPSVPIVQAGENIAFEIENGVVTAHIQIQYSGPAAEFAAGAVAAAILGQLQVLQQFGNARAGDLRGFHQRTRRIRDAVDAAVFVVAVRVTRVVLHVADQRVVPVNEVERTVRRELQVKGGDRLLGHV